LAKIVIPFKPHKFQEEIFKSLKRFSVLVCHRRFGKTVLCVNLLIRWGLSSKKRAWRGAYIAPLFRQAKAIAWDYLVYYCKDIPGVKFYTQELRADFPNGARIMLLGSDNPDSLRGIYLDAAIMDEYADIRPQVYSLIIAPAITDRQGSVIWMGTPRGHNHFFDVWQQAQENSDWYHAIYKVTDTDVLDPVELERRKGEMSEDEFKQEFLCSFEAAIQGAYYGTLLEQAEAAGRITNVPYDPIIPVHTAWDLGVRDRTVIWFMQRSPSGEIRLIDYHENEQESLEYYIRYLRDKPYVYGTHLAPHDIRVKELGTGRTRIEMAEKLGLKFEVVQNIPVFDGINAVRSILPRCWFDKTKCKDGIEALKTYKKEYSALLKTYADHPTHDFASHGADAFRMLAVGLNSIEEVVPQVLEDFKPKLSNIRGANGWML
jgi:phage terminase large subunit